MIRTALLFVCGSLAFAASTSAQVVTQPYTTYYGGAASVAPSLTTTQLPASPTGGSGCNCNHGVQAAAPVTSYYAPQPATSVQPTTSYYAPQPAATVEPITTYYAPTAPAPVTTYYAPAPQPVTTYYTPQPVVQPAPITTYYAPQPVAQPVTAYYAPPAVAAPLPAAVPAPVAVGPSVYVGRGITGSARAYMTGQPIRNFGRWLLP